MRMSSLVSTLLALSVLVLVGTSAHAQEATIARNYVVTPKDGMVAQFEAAVKSHLQWRVDNGDPWTWGVSTVEVGQGDSQLLMRADGKLGVAVNMTTNRVIAFDPATGKVLPDGELERRRRDI